MIDLATRRRLAQYRTGPWLRNIAVDEEAGIAYVSSLGGIYAVSYTTRLPALN